MNRLYAVTLSGGRNNRSFDQFYENLTDRGAKSPGFAGFEGIFVLHVGVRPEDMFQACRHGVKKPLTAVKFTEITSETLKSVHADLFDVVLRDFLPHYDYPNIPPPE